MKDKCSVCHFTSTHLPKDQRIFYKQCISLSNNGYDVTLVEQGESQECQGVHIVGTGEQNNNRFYRLLIRPKIVYKLALQVNADIYQFHDMELIPYGLKLKKKGKKVIFDYHEDYASRFADSDALPGPKWLKKLIAFFYCRYEQHAVSKFDAMISVTPHICNRLTNLNSNTIMVTNYPLLDNESWSKTCKYNKKSDYIAFAGQVSDTYGLTHITEAIQKIEKIRFKFCGPERKGGDLERILAADINHHDEYLGQIPYMMVPSFLQNSLAAVILPGYSNNTAGKVGTLGNNKLFEAMLCGVPVICTDFDLWKQIIEKYKCGLYVNPYNIEELTNAIKYIVNNPKEAEQMGSNGRKAAMTEFNWSTQEKKLLDLYTKIR